MIRHSDVTTHELGGMALQWSGAIRWADQGCVPNDGVGSVLGPRKPAIVAGMSVAGAAENPEGLTVADPVRVLTAKGRPRSWPAHEATLAGVARLRRLNARDRHNAHNLRYVK